MIRHLGESMPGARIDTVEMDETTVEPLDAVLAQLPPEGTEPVMITGLEKAVSSAEAEHPVLFHLNLSRPEWPRKVPRPVVLWVPEYVLGFLGREAPDFLDWRSDTLYFPEPVDQDLRVFDSTIWEGGEDGRMPEPERRARIAELRARLAQRVDTEDPSALAAYSDWMSELGSHLFLLGELEEGERLWKEALSVEERLDRPDRKINLYNKLGEVYQLLGRFLESEQVLRQAIALGEQTNDNLRLLVTCSLLALVLSQKGDISGSDQLMVKVDDLVDKLSRKQSLRSLLTLEKLDQTLSLLERQGHLSELADLCRIAGDRWTDQGDLERAEVVVTRALEVDQKLGYQTRIADDYRLLGRIYRARGDLDRAEQTIQRMLEVGECMGALPILADGSRELGDLYWQGSQYDKAREAWTRARDLYAEMGESFWLELIQARLPP